ncbi:MAG TPA: regulatory protein RecX [Ktedonobacterales bacterium]|nr:regulatory protein RecX [Ktedonobacterales bacterium]
MNITALTPQPRNPGRWNLFLDGAFVFALDGAVVLEHGLAAGQELTAEAAERLRTASAEQDLYAAALHYLAARPRSRAEVRRRLLRARPQRPAPEADTVERVLERLERASLLNDQEFAGFWIENRERFSPRSARALGMELRQRGVDRATVDAATDATRDDERALAAGRQRLRSLVGLDFNAFRERLGGFLLRRGFSYSVARGAVRALWAESHGDETPDGDRAEDGED